MSSNPGMMQPTIPQFREGEEPSASRLEENDRLVRSITGAGGTRVQYRPDGRISIDGGALSTWTYFGYRLTAGNSLKIAARAVAYHSDGTVINIAEQDVLMSGSPCWVYASVNKATAIATVSIGTTRPTSDATFANLVLYRFDVVRAGVYRLGHCGWWDFNFMLPLATS